MKHNLFFLLFIFVFSFVNSQVKLDSLYMVWEDKTQADSIRIKALDDFIWDGYLFSQPDSALILAKQLFDFSVNIDYKKGMALGLNLQGIAYHNKNDYSKSLDYSKRSLQISEDLEDKKQIASKLHNIGSIYKKEGNYVKTLAYYNRSLRIKEELGDKKRVAFSLISIGNVYYVKSDYPNALRYYQKSLIIREEIEDKKGVSGVLNNIGNIYFQQEDFNNALTYLQRSLEIKEQIGDKKGIANSLNNIGNVFMEKGNDDEALDYYQRSIEIKEELGDKKGMANSLGNIGTIYKEQNNFQKALEYYLKILKIYEDVGGKYEIAQTLSHIGKIYNKQGKYDFAIENCKKSIDLLETIGSISELKKSCECLYNAYKAKGNGNRALIYHEQMLVFNDSLQTEETAKKLQQMEFRKLVLADSLVQVEKDLKVEMTHQTEVRKKDKNRNLALGAGVFFLFLSGGFYGRWRFVKKSKAIIEKEKDRSENLLLNILPSEIAEELKLKGSADARDFDLVSIIFTDFKGFTQASEKLTAKALIAEINHCFMAFDHICEKHGIEKIKTIGDAYMAAGGLPVPSDDSIKQTILAALEMQSFITNRITEKQAKNEVPFEMRLGIHTGPVVAGIVGVKKFQYDIWGDTVNTASRMESSGEIGKVNISQDTYALIKDDPQFVFEARGKIQAKGKGEIEMFFVTKTS